MISPKGINQSLLFIGPGYAKTNPIKREKSVIPLQGSPTQTPWVPSIPMVLIPSSNGNSPMSSNPRNSIKPPEIQMILSITALSINPKGWSQNS